MSNEEEWTSSAEARSDGSDDEVDMQATAETALKKLAPHGLEEFEKVITIFLHLFSSQSLLLASIYLIRFGVCAFVDRFDC